MSREKTIQAIEAKHKLTELMRLREEDKRDNERAKEIINEADKEGYLHLLWEEGGDTEFNAFLRDCVNEIIKNFKGNSVLIKLPFQDLKNAFLMGVDFSRSSLRETDFQNADLTNAIFYGCKIDPEKILQAKYIRGIKIDKKLMMVDYKKTFLEGDGLLKAYKDLHEKTLSEYKSFFKGCDDAKKVLTVLDELKQQNADNSWARISIDYRKSKKAVTEFFPVPDEYEDTVKCGEKELEKFEHLADSELNQYSCYQTVLSQQCRKKVEIIVGTISSLTLNFMSKRDAKSFYKKLTCNNIYAESFRMLDLAPLSLEDKIVPPNKYVYKIRIPDRTSEEVQEFFKAEFGQVKTTSTLKSQVPITPKSQ